MRGVWKRTCFLGWRKVKEIRVETQPNLINGTCLPLKHKQDWSTTEKQHPTFGHWSLSEDLKSNTAWENSGVTSHGFGMAKACTHTQRIMTCQPREIFSLGLCASVPTPMKVSHLFTILSMGSFLLLHSSNPGDNVSLIHAMEEFKACQYYWEVHRLHFSTIYKYDNPLLCWVTF